jgi:hypothetical protein
MVIAIYSVIIRICFFIASFISFDRTESSMYGITARPEQANNDPVKHAVNGKSKGVKYYLSLASIAQLVLDS